MSQIEVNWNLLSDLVHQAVNDASKNTDITHIEAFFTGTQTTEVTIRDSEIQSQSKLYDLGVGFRVATAVNKVGFACTNTLDKKTIFGTVEKALAIAKVSSEVPNFSLPEVTPLPNVNDLFDSQIDEITVEEVVDVAKRVISAAEDFDKRVIAKSGSVVFTSGWRGIINSLGVDFEEQETKAVLYLAGSGQQSGESTGSCYDIMFSRRVELEPEKVGENVGKSVIQMFNKQTVDSFEGTVIFDPVAVSYQLMSVLVDALKGEHVVSGRSAWTKSLDQDIASKNLTILDNAILEKGFASKSFDDEGCATQKTNLINKGILESFLHLATSANALKSKSTGNASRFVGGFDVAGAIIGNGYRVKPAVYPSNLVIQPGNKTQEELISETNKGVLIENMAGFPQQGSGVISAQLSRAFFIENGEIKFPIKSGMISGVAFDWFKQISGIGKDIKQFQNAVVPSLRIEGVKVIGE
ncbi:MAG: TldD/PmbA family protein [Candidatus Hermodarchaeota archaeon]